MDRKTVALPLLGGVAIGGVAGFIIAGGLGGAFPSIEAKPASVVRNTAYQLVFWNFPPNTQLVSARNSTVVGGDLVNVGTTDGAGKLVVNSTSPSTAGTYYLYAFDAPTGKYCAVYTLIVT